MGHGLTRIEWLAGLAGLDPAAPGAGRGRAGLRAVGRARRGRVPDAARDRRGAARRAAGAGAARGGVAVLPDRVLGYWVRRLAEAGFGALVATSPPRLASPEGGPPVTGTNPFAIAVPAADGRPIVADVSMAAVTHGEVLAGRARPEDVVPFGGEQAYKAFALAVGLEALVGALAGEDPGAVLLVAHPEHDAGEWLRARAPGVRLPGDGRPERPRPRVASGSD